MVSNAYLKRNCREKQNLLTQFWVEVYVLVQRFSFLKATSCWCCIVLYLTLWPKTKSVLYLNQTSFRHRLITGCFCLSWRDFNKSHPLSVRLTKWTMLIPMPTSSSYLQIWPCFFVHKEFLPSKMPLLLGILHRVLWQIQMAFFCAKGQHRSLRCRVN